MTMSLNMTFFYLDGVPYCRLKISGPFFGTHCIGQIAIVVLFLARRRMRISVMLDVLGMGLQNVAEI